MNTAAQIIQTQPAGMPSQPKGTLGDWAKNGGFKKSSDINYGQLATGAVGLMGETMNNLRNNTDAKSAKAFNVNAGSFDELGSQFESYKPLDFGRENPFFEGLKGSLQSGASGAAAGSAAGPIGTLIGGIAGTALGGFSGTFGALKRNKQGEEAESRLNPLSMNRFEGTARSLREDSISNSLINYAAMGGQLSTQGGNFKTGLEVFGNGGRHEENPNGGIPQGVDSQGVPNTVEEGETKFKNYIFSNREVVDKDLQKGLGLSGRLSGKTFAQASKMINKSREERPNDVIANRTADAQLNTLRNLQEETKQIKQQVDMAVNQAASGGQLKVSKSNTKAAYNNTGASEDLAFQTWYSKNTLEGQNNIPYSDKLNYDYYSFYKNGDYKNPDYNIDSHFPDTYKRTSHPTFSNESIYSTPEKPGGSWMQDTYKQNGKFMYASGGSIHIDPSKKGTFTAAATKHDMGVQAFARKVLANKENYSSTMVKKANFAKNAANWHARGGPLEEEAGSAAFPRFDLLPPVKHNIVGRAVVQNPIDPIKGSTIPQKSTSENEGFDFNQIGMMAPAISNGIQLMSAISSKPDVLSLPRVKGGTRLSEDFRYNPLDREYIANKLRAESGATRKGIINTSGGNRATAAAGLLTADKNFLTGLGDAYFKADEMNQNKLMQIAQLRNQARQVNANIGLQEGQINSGIATTEFDYNARARAARANAIREGLAALSQNATDLGNYASNKETVNNMFSNYGFRGNFKK